MKAENPLLMRPNQTHLSESSTASMAEQRLDLQLTQALAYLQTQVPPLHTQDFGYLLLFSVASESSNSSVFLVEGSSLEAAWRKGATRVRQWAWARQQEHVQLRIDWVLDIAPLPEKAVLHGTASWKNRASKALAVADAGLETAIPLLQTALMDDDDSLQFAHLPGQPGHLLHLQGIYIEDGFTTVTPLSHFRGLGQSQAEPDTPIPAPFTTVLDMLLQQVGGSWEHCHDFFDHLCHTYALLQIQARWQHKELGLAKARAIDYILAQPQWMTQDDISISLTLLVLCRYLAYSETLAPTQPTLAETVAQLAQSLRTESALAKLALQAGAPSGTTALSSTELLHELMELALQCLRQTSSAPLSEAAQAIVVGEIAHLRSALQTQCGPQLDLWQHQVQRCLDEISECTIWPEIAIYLPWELRHHAVFLKSDSLEILFKPDTTVRMFSLGIACAQLLDALTPESPSSVTHNSSSALLSPAPAHIEPLKGTPAHQPMSWDKATVAQLMDGQWLEPISASSVNEFRGLQASLQTGNSGAAILVRQADYVQGVPVAALPALQKTVLISNPPQGLLHYGCPVLQADDIPQGLRNWARAARNRVRGPVIVAVGRAGKTSTLSMVRQCMQGRADPHADALLSQDIALQMINWSDSSPCALAELAWQNITDLAFVHPDTLIVTNVCDIEAAFGTEPTDEVALEEVATRKILPLLQAIRPNGSLVISHRLGSTLAVQQAAHKRGIRIATFGSQAGATVRGSPSCGNMVRATIQKQPEPMQLQLHLQANGEHMAANALAALATLDLHVFPRHFVEQLNRWLPLPGAGQPELLPDGMSLLQHSHCASITAMHAAFRQLQMLCPNTNQRVVVLAGLPNNFLAAAGMEQVTLMLEALLRTTGARRVLLHGASLRRLADALNNLLHVNWYDDLNTLIGSLLLTKNHKDTILLAGTESINLAIASEAIRDSYEQLSYSETRPSSGNKKFQNIQSQK